MLSRQAGASGYRLVHHARVASTMDEARALLPDSDGRPFWVVADEQTGGRGRHGRAWASPPGNLYATLALTEPCEPPRGPELGFVAGLALHGAVAEASGLEYPRLGIKWPNDLLVNRAKVAGLLLEGLQVGGAYRVLIGFGVNVASAPEGTPYPAGALVRETAGREVSVASIFKCLSGAWVAEEARWREGFAPTRAAWLERAAFLGETITVRPPSGAVTGVMRGVDAQGRLLLEQDGQAVTIDAGDVAVSQARA